MVGLFAPRLLLWLRQRGLNVVLVVVEEEEEEEEEEGLLGVAPVRRSELNDLRIRWYAFLIESSSTPESLLPLLCIVFLTGAIRRNKCIQEFLRANYKNLAKCILTVEVGWHTRGLSLH